MPPKHKDKSIFFKLFVLVQLLQLAQAFLADNFSVCDSIVLCDAK